MEEMWRLSQPVNRCLGASCNPRHPQNVCRLRVPTIRNGEVNEVLLLLRYAKRDAVLLFLSGLGLSAVVFFTQQLHVTASRKSVALWRTEDFPRMM